MEHNTKEEELDDTLANIRQQRNNHKSELYGSTMASKTSIKDDLLKYQISAKDKEEFELLDGKLGNGDENSDEDVEEEEEKGQII